jgi:hypothetical protein
MIIPLINTQLQLGVVDAGFDAEPFQRFTDDPKTVETVTESRRLHLHLTEVRC